MKALKIGSGIRVTVRVAQIICTKRQSRIWIGTHC